ncbi:MULTISPECIES: ABC transporter substrate-binding protein [Burkholderia]|uniref:Extracellular solute-binding protein n=1 Tax=Burkholderia aenigmatica TaxID=2015348 RepID=A0A6J5IPG1_9BURK|nr:MULTISPECIES: ABC transporter substrate-binding protein [Burkholderia]CAB3961605.1 extracellular solute-binding protein [Burkholderia aenigmatica]
MRKKFGFGGQASRCACGAMAAAALCASAQAQDVVTFASYGGEYQKNIVKALIGPAASEAGVGFRQETHDGLAPVRLQVRSGRPAWDLVQLGTTECSIGSAEGLFEAVDYRQVPKDGLPADATSRDWVGTNYMSVVLAYRTDKYRDRPPQTWADFWNTAKYPGRRALEGTPEETMEIALLADGVAPDKLYPLDQSRALAALKRIRPQVVAWWTSGAQVTQLLRDGEADMVQIWGSRVPPLIRDGAPVAYTYNGALLTYSCMAIPKGARHAAAAQRLLAHIVSPAVQANLITVMPYYGPVNTRVFERGHYTAAQLAETNSAPGNRAKQVVLDPGYWSRPGLQQKASLALRALISE